MACSTCKRSAPQYVAPKSLVIQQVTPCVVTEDEVKEVYHNLVCYSKDKQVNVNGMLGQLLTMINLKEYCRFSLEEIKDFLNGYTC